MTRRRLALFVAALCLGPIGRATVGIVPAARTPAGIAAFFGIGIDTVGGTVRTMGIRNNRG